MGDIEKMFNPNSVALIGATEREGAIGQVIMKNLLSGKNERNLYPVNPNKENIMGLECYPSITKVPAPVDLAIIVTPAKSVPSIVEECGEAGVEGITVISAGFKEIGDEGRKLEEEIKTKQKKYGFRLLGPNCIGFIRPHIKLNATFLRRNPEPGQIAFIAQSGALGSAMLDWAVSSHIGFSMFAALGSMLEVDFGDLINYLGEDPYTRSIIIYMESVGNAREFLSAARGFARTKPIIIIKPGKYVEGAKAAVSHTGAMAGDYEVYAAAFKRVGIVRVNELEDLFNCASVLDSRYLPLGSRMAAVTNAGGPAVVLADEVMEQGGELTKLSEKTLQTLNSFLPHYWSHRNPVDILGDADVNRYIQALQACLSDPNVDGAITIYTPQGAAPSTVLAEAVSKIANERYKPVITVWMGEQEVREGRDIFYRNNIPTYTTPEQAVRTYMYMYKYARNLELLYETPEELPVDRTPPKSHLKVLIRKALRAGRKVLTAEEADSFLDVYGIPRAKGVLAKDVDEAIRAASTLGYPVVLKIVSPDIIHKTDVSGVVTGIKSEKELKEKFTALIDRIHAECSEAKIEGMYVQKMVDKIDYELILGSKKDRDFGAIILFGSGGVGVNVFRDFSIGLPPLNQVLAGRIMQETKIYKSLSEGLRNCPPANLKLLEEIIVKFSNLIVDFPEIAEMDINPITISGSDAYAVDSRIIIDTECISYSEPYPHLVVMPYPTKYVMPYRLKDGTEVILRPIRPEDEQMEYEFIRGLSEESSRFRFFRIIKDLSHEDLVRFCNIDYYREMAIIAELREGDRRKEIGVSRLIIEPNKKRGEFALVIDDKYQGKGLGKKLLDMLITIAEEKGLESIYGIVLPENVRMVNLCKKLGATVKHEAEETIAEIKLR